MGLTIAYKHVTTDLNKIKQLIQDMKQFAENTGRYFKSGISKGYLLPPSRTLHLDGTIEQSKKLTDYHFYDASLTHLANAGEDTIELFFEIEIKNARKSNLVEIMRVGWARHGAKTWICNDWHKLWGPSGGDEERVAKTVIEMIAILEYIQKYYFPTFWIDDDFDFHLSVNEINRQFWRDILAGKHENYRRPDGTFPDYQAEHDKLKNHDIKNIYRSIGLMNQTFRHIEGELAKAGWSKDQIVKDMPLIKGQTEVSIERIPLGDIMVNNIHNTIKRYSISQNQPRIIKPMIRRMPINRILLTRKDGVKQHYHKRLPGAK